jgi:hypothetical protein
LVLVRDVCVWGVVEEMGEFVLPAFTNLLPGVVAFEKLGVAEVVRLDIIEM